MRREISAMKCAIFDMDGTLVDSMPMWHTVADKYLLQNKRTPEEDLWDRVKRLTETETADYFIERYGIEKSREKICGEIEDIIFREYNENVGLKEGALDFLETLRTRNIPIALATATNRTCVIACLERLGIIDFFTVIHTCLDLNTSKHLPYIFEKSAADCGCKVSETAVFEDALHCIRTAKNAGFTVAALYDASSGEITEPPLSDWQRITQIADVCAQNFNELLKDN